jgi:hypothetical protein
MQLRRPKTSWSAVVRGAVLCGVEKGDHPGLVRTSAFEKSYGIVLHTAASNIDNPGAPLMLSRHSQAIFAEAQMIWLFGKGDVILDKTATSTFKALTITFTGPQSGKQTTNIYSYAKENRPTDFNESHAGMVTDSCRPN